MKSIDEKQELAFIVLGIVVILLSCAEIVLILQTKNRKTFDKLLLSLALSDWLVGIVVTVFKIIDFVAGMHPWLKEDVFAMVFIMSSAFSIKNLLFITFDRLLAIRFPIKHRVLVTGRLVNIMIVIIWIVVLFFNVGVNLILIIVLQRSSEYYIYLSAIAIIVWGIFIVIVYGWILRVLLTRQILARVYTNGEKLTIGRRIQSLFTGQYKAERAVVFTSVLVAVSFIICTYPFAIEYLIRRNAENISFPSRVLIFLNSLFNPLVYFFKNYLGKVRMRTERNATEVN